MEGNKEEVNKDAGARRAPKKPAQAHAPGTFKPVIQTELIAQLEKPGTVFHDFLAYGEFTEAFATYTYGDHEKVTANPETDDKWMEMVKKMMDLTIAKKFAASLPVADALEQAKIAVHLAKMEIFFPSALLNAVNMFGKIRSPNGDYNVAGQIFVALTYAMRALHPDINEYGGVAKVVDRKNNLFVNAASPATLRHAKEWLTGYVNAWSISAPPITINMGDVDDTHPLTMTVPHLHKGGAAYKSLLAGLQNIPDKVTAALNSLILLESWGDNPQYTPAMVHAAYGAGIQVVNASRDDMAKWGADYGIKVQPRLLATLGTRYNMVAVKTMSDVGTSGQLIRRERPEFGTAPDKIDEEAIDIGWMLSGSMSFARMEPERYQVVSKKSPTEMKIDFFTKMRKNE